MAGNPMPARPRTVVIGAGFGKLWPARAVALAAWHSARFRTASPAAPEFLTFEATGPGTVV